MTGVTLGLFAFGQAQDNAVLTIYADNGGAPSAPLGSWVVGVPALPSVAMAAPWTQALPGTVVLRTGHAYYLGIASPDESTLAWTHPTSAGAVSEAWYRGPVAWSRWAQGAPVGFEVIVPAPGSMTGLGLAAGCACLRQRR